MANSFFKKNGNGFKSAWKHRQSLCVLALMGSLLGNYMQCNKNDTSKGSRPLVSRLFNDTPVVSNVVSNNDNTVSFDLKKQEGLYAKANNPFQFYYKKDSVFTAEKEVQYIPASAEEASEITKSVVAEMYKDQINVSENQLDALWNENNESSKASEQSVNLSDDSAGLEGFFDTETGLAIAMNGDKVVAVNGVKVKVEKAEEQQDENVSIEDKAKDKLFIMAGTSKLEVSDAFLPVLKQIVESANESAKKSAEEQQDKKKKEKIAESVSFEQKVNYENMSR